MSMTAASCFLALVVGSVGADLAVPSSHCPAEKGAAMLQRVQSAKALAMPALDRGDDPYYLRFAWESFPGVASVTLWEIYWRIGSAKAYMPLGDATITDSLGQDPDGANGPKKLFDDNWGTEYHGPAAGWVQVMWPAGGSTFQADKFSLRVPVADTHPIARFELLESSDGHNWYYLNGRETPEWIQPTHGMQTPRLPFTQGAGTPLGYYLRFAWESSPGAASATLCEIYWRIGAAKAHMPLGDATITDSLGQDPDGANGPKKLFDDSWDTEYHGPAAGWVQVMWRAGGSTFQADKFSLRMRDGDHATLASFALLESTDGRNWYYLSGQTWPTWIWPTHGVQTPRLPFSQSAGMLVTMTERNPDPDAYYLRFTWASSPGAASATLCEIYWRIGAAKAYMPLGDATITDSLGQDPDGANGPKKLFDDSWDTEYHGPHRGWVQVMWPAGGSTFQADAFSLRMRDGDHATLASFALLESTDGRNWYYLNGQNTPEWIWPAHGVQTPRLPFNQSAGTQVTWEG
jgi:hypothetical protein